MKESIFKKNKNKGTQRSELFSTDALQIELGRWMGIIKRPSYMSYIEWEKLLCNTIQEISKRGIIPNEVFDSIPVRYLELMKDALHGEQVLKFDCYDCDKRTFVANLASGEELDVRFDYGDMDNMPEVEVTGENEKAYYEYYQGMDGRPDQLKFRSVTKKQDESGLQFVHYDDSYSYVGYIENDDFRIQVDISYNKELEHSAQVSKEAMENIICSLSFDDSIDSITRAVVKGIVVDPKTVERIRIKKEEKVKRNGRTRFEKVLEEVTFNKGKISSLVTTRNGKTVTIHDFSKWSYMEDSFTVSHDEETGKFAVTVNVSEPNLNESLVPSTYVDSAVSEVLEVKKLSLEHLNR